MSEPCKGDAMIHDDQIPPEPPVGTTLLWRWDDGDVGVLTRYTDAEDAGWSGDSWRTVARHVFAQAVGPVRAIRTDLLLGDVPAGSLGWDQVDFTRNMVDFTTIELLPHVEPDTRPEPPAVITDRDGHDWTRWADGQYHAHVSGSTLTWARLVETQGPFCIGMDLLRPADYRGGPR